MQYAHKFRDWNQSKSGVNLKEIKSLMIDRVKLNKLKTKDQFEKKNVQIRGVKSKFLGVWLCKLRIFMVNCVFIYYNWNNKDQNEIYKISILKP
jgi:hypothetical protein